MYTEIETLADAYTARGLEREEIVFDNPANDLQQAANAFIDAIVLTAALNGGRKPNFTNPLERKVPISWRHREFYTGAPVFLYNDYDFVLDNTCSFVGERLSFFDKDVAKYAAEKFPEVFKPFMTFPNSEG